MKVTEEISNNSDLIKYPQICDRNFTIFDNIIGNVGEDYGDWSFKQTDEDYCLNKTFDAVLNQRILYCEWFQVLWMVFFFYQFCIVHQGNILGKAFQFIANFWERQMVERHNPPFLGSELPNSQPYTNNRKIPHFWWVFWSWFFLITASIKDKNR